MGVEYLRKTGWKVATTNQGRSGHTRVSTGLPDVIALHPAYGCLLWEAKAQGGVLSDAQQAWGAAARESGTLWCAGPMRSLLDYLGSLKRVG